MHPSSLLLLPLTLSLAFLTTALNITSPITGTILTPNNFTITWTGNTTADHITVNLINDDLSGGGGGATATATNISASDDSYTFPASAINALTYVTNGTSWVITVNSIGSEGNAFLAESPRFAIAGISGGAATTAGSTSATGSSGLSSTATGGAGAEGSSSMSAAGTTHVTGTSASSVAAGSSSGSAAASAVTSSSGGFAAADSGKMSFAAGGVLGAAALAFLV